MQQAVEVEKEEEQEEEEEGKDHHTNNHAPKRGRKGGVVHPGGTVSVQLPLLCYGDALDS